MDSLSCGMPARFQKSDEITVNNPHSTPAIGHVQREIAVTLRRNVGHALVKSPVTITRNTLHAQTLMKPYVGKVLLLSPIVGQFSDDESSGLGFIPPRADRLAMLAESGAYPVPMQCEIHVGEFDWQSNPANVSHLASLLGLCVTVVPRGEHMLGKSYVSAVLDKWLASAAAA
ncbi:MAG: hypothetical protein ACK53F_11170 [Betaproteobacteria bacterium]